MTPRLAIGVGCRRACQAEAILAVLNDACAGLDLAGAEVFTLAAKNDEAGLHEAARRLGLPLTFLSREELAAVADRVTSPSARVARAVGVASVAEAAALVGAGPGSRLIVSRLAHAAATCAVAVGAGMSA